MNRLARLDHRFVWHPFTQMKEWLKHEPIMIVEGDGAVLRDARGREYLDANSSIWTNLHGHNHPKINAAIQRQLRKIAHTSALGLANEPAALLAEKLIGLSNLSRKRGVVAAKSDRRLRKVFFSDDGSTAMEVALKLAYEHARRTGGSRHPKFLSLEGAYHGDTVGAVSLGHIDLFHKNYAGLLFKTDEVSAPYCYRCPFNRAKPERADAREYRKCSWECLGKVEQRFERQRKRGRDYVAFVFEPLMQGAAGMIPQPEGWLRKATEVARGYGALLVADEVMTGFGRVSGPWGKSRGGKRDNYRAPTNWLPDSGNLFACPHEGVQPDFMALAKGMTGGYLPMAATLTTQAVFDSFLGQHDEFKTFFHGHSYTGNQLGAAASLASLEILRSRESDESRKRLERNLREELKGLWPLANVGDIRQVGLVAGVELVKDWRTRERFQVQQRVGARVCKAMARHGVLTRPIGDVVVIMPPYCTNSEQMRRMVRALSQSVTETIRK